MNSPTVWTNSTNEIMPAIGVRLGLSSVLILCLTGCTVFSGIPSHGAGKRFAVEQELVAASARAAALDVDVSSLAGRSCALHVVAMGDQGSGNLVGGRYEWLMAIAAAYVNSQTLKISSLFPVITTETVTSTAGIATTTLAENAINASGRSWSSSEGGTFDVRGGVHVPGVSEYRGEAFVNPLDALFLRAILQHAFTLRGVHVVSADRADVDIFVTVDVFGTHRSRTEFHLFNQERLIAKTAFQVTAFDRRRQLLLAPMIASFEAQYLENYIAWIGPFEVLKEARRSEEPLVDFRDIAMSATAPQFNPSTSATP